MDDLDLDQFDDFDSPDLVDDAARDAPDAAARGRNAYVAGLWSRYGYDDLARTDRARAVVVAHGMVQTFVDTFSTDGRWRVTFDPGLSTAGTEMDGRRVAITPAPIFDETITPREAGVILTAMGTHEVCHPRYGRGTSAAVRRAFGDRRAPNTLSNLLDDVRIERRFAAEYPGYADVFEPMLDYVARAANKKDGVALAKPDMEDLVNLAIMAVRYPAHADWADAACAAERDWWRAWADRWAREDAPRRHVEAVREGLRHVAATQVRRRRASPKAPPPSAPLAESVKRAIDSLPPLSRKAMRMSAEGRRGDEIAATLGLTPENTKTLLRLARRTVAEATAPARRTIVDDLTARVARGLGVRP